ncbi:hypothetical protein LguiA_028126 [Lonicera macranthoides]
MAVAKAWATGHSVPISSSIDSPILHSINKSLHLKFELGCGSTVTKSPILRNRKSSKLNCRCTPTTTTTTTSSNNYNDNIYSSCLDWDWNRWTRHFSEIEQAESFASLLKFQLEDAIENEDFQEAAKLKTAIAEATSKDSIAEVMSQLKDAIDEERYHDALSLCRNTGSGLVGWWVGYSKDSDDPFGRLVRVTPGVGRFVGKSYSPRQLVTASPGTPLFEIFVVKDDDDMYSMQVVFLQRTKGSTTKSALNSKPTRGQSTAEIENASVVDVKMNEDNNDEKSISSEDATEDGIRNLINFIKDKIPELKVKLPMVKQLIEEDEEDTTSNEDSENESSNLDEPKPDRVAVGGSSDAMEDGKDKDMKLFVGGVLHKKDDTFSKDEYARVPAEIEDMERDSFVLHVPMKSQNCSTEENVESKVKVAALAVQGVSELMPPDVAKAFWNSGKGSSKAFRDVREMVKLAVSQAQKREKLAEYTNFRRITTSRGDLDPFDGLYVGAFAPYGTEIVQLRRKYGNWNDVNDAEKSSDVDFFEYVEAVKLTGDLNLPAGKVTFRAKIGKGSRVSNRGLYPDELGVVASYRGQGRIAEFGFRNPKWVEGELLQLNGKGMGPYVRGADLGFLYVVPEQSFLVLFNRLKLPE